MIKVYKITEQQKDLLVNQMFILDNYFNPVLDANGNWIISIEEVNQCTNENFMWVKDLQLIDFNPIVNEL